MQRILAIDPGKEGGLAFRASDGTITAKPMPALSSIDEIELAKMILGFRPELAIIESVAAVPMSGAKTSFSFGYNVGIVRGILGTIECSVCVVLPKVWQAGLWQRYRPQQHDSPAAIKADNKQTKILTYECVKRALPHIDFRKSERCKPNSFHDGMTDAVGILLWYIDK